MNKVWVCVTLREKIFDCGVDFIKNELGKIFSNDLIDLMVVGSYITETNFENALQDYIFVKCNNPKKYINKIYKSQVFGMILCDSASQPQIVSESEIKEISNQYEKCLEKRELKGGDVVRIKEGLYSNLTGMVYKVLCNGKCKVVLKYCSRHDVITEFALNLEKVEKK